MPLEIDHLDLSLLALFAGLSLAEEAQRRLAAEGFEGLRFAHGFVIQHLVEGPVTVGELARRMAVTQQGASKAAGELERLGYVERVPDPADARVRRLQLSARGEEAVEAARAARAELLAELRERLGPRRVAAAERLLRDLLRELGGDQAVRARRVRLPT